MKRKAWGGLDLSSSQDLTAFALAVPWENYVRLLLRFWIPRDGMIEHERRDKVPYRQWLRDGWIEATPGPVIDYGMVRARIVEDAEAFDLQALFYDPCNAAETAQILLDAGLPMVEHRQGLLSMNEPCKIFERLILERRLQHNNNPVLNWCAGNVGIREDDNALIRPVKQKKNSPKRIDGIVASIMAVGGAPLSEGEKISVYETEGLLRL